MIQLKFLFLCCFAILVSACDQQNGWEDWKGYRDHTQPIPPEFVALRVTGEWVDPGGRYSTKDGSECFATKRCIRIYLPIRDMNGAQLPPAYRQTEPYDIYVYIPEGKQYNVELLRQLKDNSLLQRLLSIESSKQKWIATQKKKSRAKAMRTYTFSAPQSISILDLLAGEKK